MKLFVPLSLAILLAACAAPEDKETVHQRQLWQQARANFIALGGRVHSDATPAPASHFMASQKPAPPAPPMATPPRRPKYVAQVNPPPNPPPKTRVARNADDTLYYWQAGAPPRENTARFAASEAKYARTLAKRPENLTPEERIWAHEHY